MSSRRHIAIAYEDDPPEADRAGKLRKGQSAAPVANTFPQPDVAIVKLSDIGVLPEATDNCAIFRRRVQAGTRIEMFDGQVVAMASTILEGHRIVAVPVAVGGFLLSWGLPFGIAAKNLSPGDYVCNETMLATLRGRQVENLPNEGNFVDNIIPHFLHQSEFSPMPQVPLLPPKDRLSFMGYSRSDAQGGVGTRNYIAVIPTSALSGAFARRLADTLNRETRDLSNCDGVVALAHTEAALEKDSPTPQNWQLLLRTLAGFISHPNVAAALVVGYGGELLTPGRLDMYVERERRPLPKWYRFFEIPGRSFEEDLIAAQNVVRPWIPKVNQCQRSEQPLAELRVALQCGGSDAFSGVSGNPASGWAAKILIEHGGAAVLAETDELIGAESYILSRVRDLATAEKFLQYVDRYKELFLWHGQTPESNPSGGNKLRGLYNITLKSIGAAKKKHVDVTLDGVLDYGERIGDGERGYFFMDSPGNDLESIAGQVASGCNAILFITGNGSITNFPFVPTTKIITTSERYNLLKEDMDFNAGRFQDEGAPMADLGRELFMTLVRTASGERSQGERAGHSQVSIWRTWAQTGIVDDAMGLHIGEYEGDPLDINSTARCLKDDVSIFQDTVADRYERIALVLPTSLCSGEIARMVADELDACRAAGLGPGAVLSAAFDRFVALPHTEGCGVGHAQDGDVLFSRVVFGHLLHNTVAKAFLLEHGCEKTHNTWMKEELKRLNINMNQFGFASVQLDGGIAKVVAKAREWFLHEAAIRVGAGPSVKGPIGSEGFPLCKVPVALLTSSVDFQVESLVVALIRSLVAAGGTVTIPNTSKLFQSAAVLDELCSCSGGVKPSLAFAQPASRAGLHVMHVPKGVASQVEMITGLVATGAGVVLNFASLDRLRAMPFVGHPLVAVLHIGSNRELQAPGPVKNADMVLTRQAGEGDRAVNRRWLRELALLMQRAVSRQIRPISADAAGFQIARGPSGFSA